MSGMECGMRKNSWNGMWNEKKLMEWNGNGI
jgi:hypothetical protein